MTMTRRQPLRMLLLLLVAHQAYSVIMQHSFMGPYHPNGIPFWKHGAGANINESYVRLTPARQSRTGFHWNVIPSKMTDWQVEFDFKIEGAKMLGGDGFAFWYTSTPEVLGMVYGAADYWKGLGIFFDTYDNDAAGQTPLISAVVNDGTIKYDSASDGATQALGKCSYQIRNQDKVSRAKVKYEDETLSLSIAIDRDKDYEPCLRVSGVKLGTDKYFGLSAHTGDVADSHDIYQFSVTDLTAKDQDLDNVRNEYNKFIQSEQDKHQSLDMNQFRHEVMTMLHQIQDSLTVLESTSLSQAQSNSGSDSPLARDMSTMVQKMGGRIYDIQSVLTKLDHRPSVEPDFITQKVNDLKGILLSIKDGGGIPSGSGDGRDSPVLRQLKQLSNENREMKMAIQRLERAVGSGGGGSGGSSGSGSFSSGSYFGGSGSGGLNRGGSSLTGRLFRYAMYLVFFAVVGGLAYFAYGKYQASQRRQYKLL
eukprot:CAMPEP_0197524346 /NCGR_PEP_ID=MMETSP1318-20131121/9040_1 /TAXON_ID=552666 /ORGANISM="Partenskyella glossopodia, Strain RCC365" /LENGTH=477 /DNA_ID=CAMNT_0043077283 /DNA_START=36 /DNA_END=1469 /DNA_ORIENTATION=+